MTNAVRGWKGSFVRACLFLVLSLLSACGGGNGGSGSTVTYVGVASQALVTQANAKTLSANAYQNSNFGSTSAIAGIATAKGGASGEAPTVPELALLLQNSSTKVIQAQAAATPALSGLQGTKTVYGAAGGSADVSLSVDATTGAISGTAVFHNFQDLSTDPALSGSMTFSGTTSTTTGITSETETFVPLSVTTPQGSQNYYGTFYTSSSVNSSAKSMQLSCMVQNGSGSVFWIKDWTLTYTSATSPSMTGRYYDPTYGYVDLSTPIPLTANAVTGEPTAGELLFNGVNGTKAKLAFTGPGTYATFTDPLGTGQWVAVQ